MAGIELDKPTLKKIERATARHRSWLPSWAEQMAFYQGRQFAYRSAVTGRLNELQTARDGKAPWRARTVRNRILGYVNTEVSAGTQRVPSYEVVPSTIDAEDVSAARLAEKVLIYLYDRLSIRRHLVDAYLYAVVNGEGFIRPYWNGKVGDKLPAPVCTECSGYGVIAAHPDLPIESVCSICQGQGYDSGAPTLYTGELALEALGAHEVMWEPGARFHASNYHIVTKARSIEDVKAMPGFTGVELKADAVGNPSFVQAQLRDGRANNRGENLVMVSELLEKPSDKFPLGRRLFIANDKIITAPEDYPILMDSPEGYETALCKFVYFPTPDRDRDMGLVEHLIDPQRTLNDAVNKAIEHKNLMLAPQLIAPINSLRDPVTAEPGSVIRYQPGQQPPQWRQVPPIPESLFTMAEQAIGDMEDIASQRSYNLQQIDSGKELNSAIERDQQRRAAIVQSLADSHTKLGRVLLALVQKHYTEPRLLQINGRFGEESIPNFLGSNLHGQIDVQVLPGSVEPRTKSSIQQKVMAFADRGWISPQEAMKAIDGGYGDDLVDDYELDVEKQQREIQQITALGDPALPGGVAPFAAAFDNHTVHLAVLHKWMKTRDFETQPAIVQEAAMNHEQMHQQLQAQAQAEQAAQQQAVAMQRGMTNAAKAPPPTGQPDMPNPAGPTAAQAASS